MLTVKADFLGEKKILNYILKLVVKTEKLTPILAPFSKKTTF